MTEGHDSNRIPVWLWVAVWVLCVGATLSASSQTTELRRTNSIRLLAMSPEDQARINRSYQSYRQLTPAEREQLRTMHQEIQEDLARGGALRDTLVRYSDWLKTIPEADRQSLAAATSSRDRQLLVTRIHDQQIRTAREKALHEVEVLFDSRQQRQLLGRGLNRRDLDAVIAQLEPYVRSKLPPEKQAELDRHSGPSKIVFTHLAFQTLSFDPRVRPSPDKLEELFNRMVGAISDPEVKLLLQSQATFEGKWSTFRSVVENGARSELLRTVPPDDELTKLEGVLQGWEKAMLDQTTDPQRRRQYLTVRYWREKFPGLFPWGFGPPRDGDRRGFGPGFRDRTKSSNSGPGDQPRRSGDGPFGEFPGRPPRSDQPPGSNGPGSNGPGPNGDGRPDGPPPRENDGDRRPPEGRGPEERRPFDRRPPGDASPRESSSRFDDRPPADRPAAD